VLNVFPKMACSRSGFGSRIRALAPAIASSISSSALQILTILISRGNVTFLANLYAFGVIWSFAMNGLAVLVLRYTQPGQREFQVPLNFYVRGVQIPVVSPDHADLFAIAITNLFTKPVATIAGGIFSVILYVVFTISERRAKHGGVAHVEMDQFNLELEGELSPEAVGARPGNILVRSATLQSVSPGKRSRPHQARPPRRGRPSCAAPAALRIRGNETGTPISSSAASSSIILPGAFHGGETRNRFAWPLSQRTTCGTVFCAPPRRCNPARSSSAAPPRTTPKSRRGKSAKRGKNCRIRSRNSTWRIHLPNGDKIYKVLGPHAPNLTANEVNLLHRLWLRFSESLAREELHHHDVVHFALEEVQKRLKKATKIRWSTAYAPTWKPIKQAKTQGIALFLILLFRPAGVVSQSALCMRALPRSDGDHHSALRAFLRTWFSRLRLGFLVHRFTCCTRMNMQKATIKKLITAFTNSP